MCNAEIVIADAISELSVAAYAGSQTYSYALTSHLNEFYSVRGNNLWQNGNQTINQESFSPSLNSSGVDIGFSVSDKLSDDPFVVFWVGGLPTVYLSDLYSYAHSSTAEGDVYRVGKIAFYTSDFGSNGGNTDVTYEAHFSIASTVPILRTYLSEYSIVQGDYVPFNDSGPLGGAASATVSYSWQATHSDESPIPVSRFIDVLAVVAPVPEPSTYAMALAGIACGGYSMFRGRKRA